MKSSKPTFCALIAILLAFLFFPLTSCEDFSLSGTDYLELKTHINHNKHTIQQAYKEAPNKVVKEAIVDSTFAYLYATITDELFKEWYGTKWDFNGTTEVPHKGKIACGYFVTTILRDAGFKVERRKLAQQASEKIVKSLVTESYIKRFKHKSIDDFVKGVTKMGDGLYIVGLDTHVGFLSVEGRGKYVRFVHAAQSSKGSVRSEAPNRSKVLKKSKYRIAGKILPNRALQRKWLVGGKVRTVGK